MAVGAVWLIVALAIAIPHSRAADGLTAANHFVIERYGAADGTIRVPVLIGRVFSSGSALTLAGALGTFGLLSLGAPTWLLVIGPGLILNLAARPDTLQAALAGHYFWPILPWMAIAALAGLSTTARHCAPLCGDLVHDTWPFSRAAVSELVQTYSRDQSLTSTASGPLYALRRIARAP